MIYNSDYISLESQLENNPSIAKSVLMDLFAADVYSDIKLDTLTLPHFALLCSYRLVSVSSTIIYCLWNSISHSDSGVLSFRTILAKLKNNGLITGKRINLVTASNGKGIGHGVRSVYFLSNSGCDYLYRTFGLPELNPWNRTSSVRALHDYFNSLSMLQLSFYRHSHADGYHFVPPVGDGVYDVVEREYMLSHTGYSTARRLGAKGANNLVSDSLYSVCCSEKASGNFPQIFPNSPARTYITNVWNPVPQNTFYSCTPYSVFVEQDMFTERNPVLINKLAKYVKLNTFSFAGIFSYSDTSVLFSCFDKAPCCMDAWALSNKDYKTLLQRASVIHDGEEIRCHEFLELNPDLSAPLKAAYREIFEFYRTAGYKISTAKSLLLTYHDDYSSVAFKMEFQRTAAYHHKRASQRLQFVMKELLRQVDSLGPYGDIYIQDKDCCHVASELLRGLHCYFLPCDTISQTADRLFFDPDYYAWYVNCYFVPRFRGKPNNNTPPDAVISLAVYPMLPAEYCPQTYKYGKHYIQFGPSVVMKREDTGETLVFVFEDLSDLGSWYRVKEYFEANPDGCEPLRIVMMYDRAEDIDAFMSIIKPNIKYCTGYFLSKSPAGMEFLPHSVYRKDRHRLDRTAPVDVKLRFGADYVISHTSCDGSTYKLLSLSYQHNKDGGFR